MRSRAIVIAAGVALLFAAPAAADAQVHFGPQLSFASDTDLGVGARLLVNVKPLEHWDFIGSFDWFFPDEGGRNDNYDYWELNGSLAYNFMIEGAPGISPYAGAGLNIAHASVDFVDGGGASDTDVGLNLLAGTKFGSAKVLPFVEFRAILSGGDQVVITGGVLF